MIEIISKKEAKALGLARYFTGRPCRHGHFSTRGVTSGACHECQRLLHRKRMLDPVLHAKHLQVNAKSRRKARAIYKAARNDPKYANLP